MFALPASYATTLTNAGTCPLTPTLTGWEMAEQGGGVPQQGGTSVLLGRSATDQPWKAVFLTSANHGQGLHARWFTQNNPNLMAFRHLWAQSGDLSMNWCCLLAQMTALAGQPPIAPCLRGHPTHPVGSWEFSIRWRAAPDGRELDPPNRRRAAFVAAMGGQVAVDGNLPGAVPIASNFLAQRLAAIGACGCP